MKYYLDARLYDLVTPDGSIIDLNHIDDSKTEALIYIEGISPAFVGFEIEPENVFFNIKSTIAQFGINGELIEFEFDNKHKTARVRILLTAIGFIGRELLKLIRKGAYVGKLFAADSRRKVRDPHYLSRMFGRSDSFGRPLLSLGGLHGSGDLILDKIDGRTVAFLTVQNGRLEYGKSIYNFLPTVAKALITNHPMRELIKLHQRWNPLSPHNIQKDELLLVRTLPLHIRTVFAHVVEELLSKGYNHTTACILQPDTFASGDIYELFGENKREITDIPLEFFTLEPYREHVFFEDRDQLQSCLEDTSSLFDAFATYPNDKIGHTAVFVVKGEQMLDLKEEDWIVTQPNMRDFPGLGSEERQALMVKRFIEQLAPYPFLKAIEEGIITSQGILLTRYLPSPLMKRQLLSSQIQRFLKGIYFQYPSQSSSGFFSSEDRSLLHDLHKFAIPVFWVDSTTNSILQYVQKPDSDAGMFVPTHKIETFLKSTVFGIYGSNLLEGEFESEITYLLQGLLDMKSEMSHPLLKSDTPLSLVTGGGPGAMEVGNRVAKKLGILSCANILDFRTNRAEAVINEQKENPYIEAKMTYRLDKLVERQAEFNLDFPIFLVGGIGTDFEFALEEVKRKVGAIKITPVLLFGGKKYWQEKISSRFKLNKETGTIIGSEWLSNCLYVVDNAIEGLKIYRSFFEGKLKLGKDGPIYDDGFATIDDL